MKKSVLIQLKSGNRFFIDVEVEKLPELLAELTPYKVEMVDLLDFLSEDKKPDFDNMFIVPAEIDSVLIGEPEAFNKQSQITVPKIRL